MSSALLIAMATVHPRACGEQVLVWVGNSSISGSSPRLRGTVPHLPARGHCQRFIPALAGNRTERAKMNFAQAVHPRACGEQTTPAMYFQPDHGSSPRLRGTESACPVLLPSHRFIPALAGNSSSRFAPNWGPAVHPRACGEQFCLSDFVTCIAGSSPRLRGTDHILDTSSFHLRFIPALAGNSR